MRCAISILHVGEFRDTTLLNLLKVNEWPALIPAVTLSAGFLMFLEYGGL